MPTLDGERVRLRLATEEDVPGLLAILTSDTVREWWISPNSEDELRCDLREFAFSFAIEAEGELAGFLAVSEEEEPDYRHAAIDIAVGGGSQGRGLGAEALRTAIAWLVGERGHHRVTIDPAAHNERAVRTYQSVGFRPVGLMRKYERGRDGRWHDNLLMDLLAEEL